MAELRLCSIPGCDKPVRVKSRGWCNSHWIRWSRYGDPTSGGASKDAALRYLTDVVLPFKGDECLFWPHSKTSDGYGRIGIDGDRGPVHRRVCEEMNGPPPSPRHEAAHSCGNGHLACVTPKHLSWKTRSENFADKLVHGTDNRGEKNGYSKITEETARSIKQMKGKASFREIAELHSTTTSVVSHIFAGRSWAWLD